MRILTYNVNGQKIIPTGNHSGLIAGTKKYLKAKFDFNDDWNNCIKVVTFYSGSIEEAVMLESDGLCYIPDEVLTTSTFEVKIEGRRHDGYRIVTDPITERQKGGVS